ncbi:MAG: DUF5110 domain-containing protein [Chitinispirillaceae bacterium]|nr:DUF5110 domain-containing protein [Chitinispirillaceae bacterium]
MPCIVRGSFIYLILPLLFLFFIAVPRPGAEVKRVKHTSQGSYCIIEILDDDLIHVEYGKGQGAMVTRSLAVSPMIYKKSYQGPSSFNITSSEFMETPDLRLLVNKTSLEISFIDKTKGNEGLTAIMPLNLGQPWKGISATRTAQLDIYGLGQQFVQPGASDIDWDGRVREGGEFGNIMAQFNDGANGNTQVPVIYAVEGATDINYALFLDNKYKQRWDFTGSSHWKVEMWGDEVRFYLMSGANLPDLRQDYMELVGCPPVPPKKMFGLWVSEYGYDNWAELENVLASLRTNQFPVDGFVLDLQWFGGVQADSDSTRMGCLVFDTVTFARPAQKIRYLDSSQGIGIMLIEEAYIGKALPEHNDLKNRGFLVKDKVGGTDPVYLDNTCTHNTWWGKGGMLDYTNDSCGRYWHDTKRHPLIAMGVIGHWTDLGEPELYAAMHCQDAGGYTEGSEADAHNIFNFKWLRSISQGYARHGVTRRPFMMSRSGAAGIQRFGAAMWSGDISSHLSSLAAHWANQMHMSFSGIDYYGSDIGGFHRRTPVTQLNEMYTQWFAYSMLFDIPGRPHAENLQNNKKTAPDRIGHRASNLSNVRLRYELIPYLYSLAHRAHRYGEPVMPSLAYYYQTDNNVRSMGHEKMIGEWLLAAPAAKIGERNRDVYLPAGIWYDYHSHTAVTSSGQWIKDVSLYRNGIFTVPLYAKEGAIVPLMHVDSKTMNALGKRSDGSRRDKLIVKVFPVRGKGASSFTLYEDDGVTTAYRDNQVRLTDITLVRSNDSLFIVVHASQGTYLNAPAGRRVELRVASTGAPKVVLLNNDTLAKSASSTAFANTESGWFFDAANKILHMKSDTLPVTAEKKFFCLLDPLDKCASEYDLISVPGTGNGWNPADENRILSRSNCSSRVWKGYNLRFSSEQYKFAANGSWAVNWGANGKQDGPNFPALGTPGMYNVIFNEADPAHPAFELVTADTQALVSARFICENGHTTFGISVYVVGSVPELGSWDPSEAIKLEPDGPYPAWTGTVTSLPPETRIEWKCIKRHESGDKKIVAWEPGANNVFTTPVSGSAGKQKARF